ncbi:MAG: DUF2314 domain-containing protein [Spirochaetaceae bacterium]|jgi:uncharacterized protein YegJ (DUF2314 family)|nr:DUF2314 domain-containing protein [Spirochaetaceae bacterium]
MSNLLTRARFAGLVFIAFAGLAFCGRPERNEGFNPIAQAEEDDPVLRAIAVGARGSFGEFTRRLRRPAEDEYNFQVKYPFAADPDSGYVYEYLWLKDIEFTDGKFSGVLANGPLHVRDLVVGGRVEFLPDDIADWMYMKRGRIRGGDSIKYLIEKIPPANREEALERYLGLFE